MIGRRQLPVYSPLPASALVASITPGDPRASLAGALRAQYASHDVVLTTSGTCALTLALLAAASRRPGAPVAIPGYACYDLVSAAVGAGVPVTLYDLDPATLAPEPASLDAALAGGAAALVVVHLFGVPVPMDLMRAAADSAGALLIEDAAQASGGTWDGRPLGAHGDYGVLSFGRGKGETGGGGGALLLHRGMTLPPEVRAGIGARHSAGLPFVLKLAAQWALGRPGLYSIPAAIPILHLGETLYRDPQALRAMTSASARVLARTRPRSAAEANIRRMNADRFRDVLGDRAKDIGITPAAGGDPGWLRFPVRLRVAPDLIAAGDALGISPAYPRPLRELPAIVPLLADDLETPGATGLSQVLRTLPTHSRLTRHDLARIERWLAKAIADAR